jgi:hypothetical protein
MPRALSSLHAAVAITVLGLLLGGCSRSPAPATPDVLATRPQTDDELAAAVELPSRRSAPTRATPPPEVPEVLAAPAELTLSLERRGPDRAGGSRRETIARSAQHVHIERADEAVEWLFIRNPRDPRRVAGRWVDHAQRVIVEYDESELRATGIARGWADIAALGARFDTLSALAPTGRVQQRAGVSFVELAPPSGDGPHVWWSARAALALPSDRAESVELLRLQPGADPELFVDPRRRFPGYAAVDVADYRESRHDHGAGDAAQRHGPHQ